MFGIQGWKLIIILIAGLVLIGPERVPEIARTLGKAMRMFNAAKDDMEKLIRADMFSAETPPSTSLSTEEPATVAPGLYADDDEEEEEE